MKKIGFKLMATGLIGAMALSMVGCSQKSESSENTKSEDNDIEISESESEETEETCATLPEDWDFENEEIFGFINDSGIRFLSYEPALNGEPYTVEIVYSDGETIVHTGEYDSLVKSSTNPDAKEPASAVQWHGCSEGRAYTVTVSLDNYDYSWVYDSTQDTIQVFKN